MSADPKDFASVESASRGSAYVLTLWTIDGEAIELYRVPPSRRSEVEAACVQIRRAFETWVAPS